MVLTDNNVPRRAIGSWKRKYNITENYFKTWSNNMAYILGFIAADGVIQKKINVLVYHKRKLYFRRYKKELKQISRSTKTKNRCIYAKY